MEDDPSAPWHACRPPAWCQDVDHVSFSLISQRLPHVYANPHSPQADVGFVLDDDNVSIACAMVVDGGTVMSAHGGCDRCTCGEPGCGWCVYRQHQLGAFVTAHLTQTCSGGQPCRDIYNEVVVLKDAYEARLPHSIRAFFCVRTPECAEAFAVRDRFVAAYPLHLEVGRLPVLRYVGAQRGFVLPTATGGESTE